MGDRLHRWMMATALLAVGIPAGAVSLGASDTFQGGSTGGWTSGAINPNQPVNVASGGPAGAGDSYLLISSTGVQGPGGKLVGINTAQWAGNYLDAGVTGVAMDVDNFGGTELDLRLTFFGSTVITDAVVVPAGSGWRHIEFAFDASSLSAVTELRLYHGPTAFYPGDNVAGTLGVDNVTAVPEPVAAWLLLPGLAAIGALRQRRRAT